MNLIVNWQYVCSPRESKTDKSAKQEQRLTCPYSPHLLKQVGADSGSPLCRMKLGCPHSSDTGTQQCLSRVPVVNYASGEIQTPVSNTLKGARAWLVSIAA